MYNRLKQFLKLPALYEKSEGAFWDDEHISKQMLKAHLNPEFEGASRRELFINESVEWINQILPVRDYPTLLDLGCGPGIYAEKLSKLGYNVTGVDYSKRSINYAKKSSKDKGLDIDYHFNNYLDLHLKKTFDVITLIYCDYGALSMDNRKQVLNNVYHHLKPGGKFLFDVFTFKEFENFKEEQTWESLPNGGFWTEEPHVKLQNNVKYNSNVVLEQTILLSESLVQNHYLWTTYFSKELIIKELEEAGFRLKEVFEDVKGTPYSKNSPTMALIVEK